MQTLARDIHSHAFLARVTKAVGSKWISLLQMPPMRTWILDDSGRSHCGCAA